MDPHQEPEDAPQVIEILGLAWVERQMEPADAVDQEPREPHDRRQHVLVVDRHAEAFRVVRPVACGDGADAGVQQAQLLRGDDGAAARLEGVGVRDV